MIVYRIENLLNGKSYIGITTRSSVEKRWQEHWSDVKRNSKYSIHMALRKYGPEHFIIQEITKGDTIEQLNELEKMYIKHYDSFHSGYNMTLGGDGVFGLKRPPRTEEQREKYRKAQTGKKASESTKEKHRMRMLGNTHSKGMTYSHSEKSKKSIGDAHRGKIVSKETGRKISQNRKGRALGEKNAMANPEARKKLSESARNRKKITRLDGTWYWGRKDQIG